MANAIYPLYKNGLMTGAANHDMDTDTTADGVYAALVDTGTYTYSTAHNFYSSISSAVIGTPVRLTSPTITANVFDAADTTFTAVTGASVEALVIYRHNSGANTTWPLIAYLDTGITGLPFTPNGSDAIIQWDAAGILAL